MSRPPLPLSIRTLALPLITLLAGLALGALLGPRASSAQSAASGDPIMAATRNGAWIYANGTLYVCGQGITIGTTPGAPICSAGTRLPAR